MRIPNIIPVQKNARSSEALGNLGKLLPELFLKRNFILDIQRIYNLYPKGYIIHLALSIYGPGVSVRVSI